MGTLNTFSSGVNTSFSTELNENFALGAVVLGSETNSTTWDSSDTTYTELATIDLTTQPTGGWTKDYIFILVNTNSEAYTDNDPDTARPVIEVQVGETGSEAQVSEFSLHGSPGSLDHGKETQNHTTFYLHTLTAGEKSNGFNVIINGKYAVGGTPSLCTGTHNQTVVIGIN